MIVLVGLGNPGSQYSKTRHNLGFVIIDQIAQKFAAPAFSSKLKSLVSDFKIGGRKILLIKPQTFMNLSGEAVALVKSFYKLEPHNFVVFYDDIYLPIAELRYKSASQAAGHNGIKSIQQYIGNDFHRLKGGIGKPATPEELSSFVLKAFSKKEQSLIEKLSCSVATQLQPLLQSNLSSSDFTLFTDAVNKALSI